jgi:hypothetical protein
MWDLLLHTRSQVWHGCLHDDTFWRWGLGLVLRVGSSKMLDPTLDKSLKKILLEVIIFNFNEYKTYFIDLWRLKSWDFASISGLAKLTWVGCGTWDLEPHVNRPWGSLHTWAKSYDLVLNMDPWLSSKGHTMDVGKTVLCSHMPSSIVWSENEPCCRTIAYFVGRKRGEDLV